MAGSGKRVWLFAILLAALFGLRLATRIWMSGPRPDPSSVASTTSGAFPAGIPSPSASISANASTSIGKPSPNTKTTNRQSYILDEILAAKNDNDPRLDTELRHLDEETKTAFRAKYRALAPEKHNERGTIVFLLGRNLTTPQDYSFFKEVLSEPPCLGFLTCSRPDEADLGDEDHQGESAAIVLAYPQLTALKALQKHPPATDAPPELRAAAAAALNAGKER